MEHSALQIAMLTAVLGSTELAIFLLLRAASATGAKPLAVFLLLVGVWACGRWGCCFLGIGARRR